MKYFSSISLAVLLLASPVCQARDQKEDEAIVAGCALLTGVAAVGVYYAYKGTCNLYKYLTTTDRYLITKAKQMCADTDKKYKEADSFVAGYLGNNWWQEIFFPTRSLEALYNDVTSGASYVGIFRVKEHLLYDLEMLIKEKETLTKRLASCKEELKSEFQETISALNERISLVKSLLGLISICYEIESRKVGIVGRIFTELLV